MTTRVLPVWIRFIVFICALALLSVLFMPFWRIELDAPQYPEGLMLQIYTSKLGGDVDVINGLNHYIGMKTLHTDDFIEFKVLPYITAAFAGLFLLASLKGTSGLLRFSFIAFLVFGIVAMADFWKWEYNYGHNLDPNAAIRVPGMAYQPPLIGYKQLLNFGAYSVPDIGGWIFIAAGVVIGALMFYDIMQKRKSEKIMGYKKVIPTSVIAVLSIVIFSSCNAQPQQLSPGKQNCDFCKMTIMDIKFATELITTKGKVYKFDDAYCLVEYLHSGTTGKKDIKEIYFVDYKDVNHFIPSSSVFLLRNEELRSPMNGNIASFKNAEERDKLHSQMGGEILKWSDLYK